MSDAPTWAYDALRICTALEHPNDGATAGEIQVFAYLACLMSIYDGGQASDWGYTFTATPAGAPYARDLADTIDNLRALGLMLNRSVTVHRARARALELMGDSLEPEEQPPSSERWVAPSVLKLSTRGEEELHFLSTLGSCSTRERYLEAATSAVRLMPLPSVSNAVTYEPGLRRALARLSTTELLDEPNLQALHDQFDELASALHERSAEQRDLLVPTAIWLTYLSETADAEALAA